MNAPFNIKEFLPRSLTCFRGYSRQTFQKDLIAGLTVGVVALPLAMAFAIASGVPPESGLYCAIVAGFLISALGGSRTQIGGPTGAFVVVVAGIVQNYGLDGLFMCTLMAGVMLVLLGLTGLGAAVKYIPRPVVIGFTNGIAVLIASTQLRDLLGLQIEKLPSDFLERMESIVRALPSWSPKAMLLSALALLLVILVPKWIPKLPGTVAALCLCSLLAFVMGIPVETIQSRFGGIPQGLPTFQIPTFRPELILKLLSPAITVAMLGAIESLLSAVVADRMSNDKHNPNVELMAQGIANIASPLVGGLPATGAIARTATNIRSGAQTPIAGMVHALTLLLIVLIAAPLAAHIPLCVLGAILLVVCYNMGEWHEIPDILKLNWSNIAVWFITFALTVLADLTVAVEAGMVLAVLLYIRSVTSTTSVAKVTEDYIKAGFDHSLQCNSLPAGVVVYRVHGPFLFGATDKLNVIVDSLPELPPIVILRLRNMTAIDATGLYAIEELHELLKKNGRQLLLCGMRDQPARFMQQAEFEEIIGQENMLGSLKLSLARAQELLKILPDSSPGINGGATLSGYSNSGDSSIKP